MKINEFSVEVYGELSPYSDVASKSRVRIFYKKGNRNGTWITDEFAEKLVSTLPYATIGGIYSEEEQDFTDHGESRSQTKIYGIVPENPNVTWEKHLDKDGVEREYACADVLLFTARYPEAKEIVGKAQSMELYDKTLKYHKEVKNGQVYAVFDDGCFLGLQALGDKHEPCFEGAAFYELQNNIESVIAQIKNYSEKGGQKMPKINFKLSDSSKYEAIWNLLNEEFNEAGNWTISYTICDVYDEYALVFSFEKGEYERVYYTKDDSTDSVVLGNIVKVFIEDITENEKNTLDTLRTLNGGTYEAVNEVLINAEATATDYAAVQEKIQEFESKIVELENENTTLNQKNEDSEEEFKKKCHELEEVNSKLESKIAECEELNTYKATVESEKKNAVIAEYEGKLSNEILDTYRGKLGEYTIIDLDKELAYELKKSSPSIFTNNQPKGLVPKDVPQTGIGSILSRYKK